MGVVVPAYNEAGSIGDCLESLRAAVRALDVPCAIVVVDDGSDDRTAEIARAVLAGSGGLILSARGGNVGAARALGVQAILANLDTTPHSSAWVATTDADTTVPADWLTYQHASAATGVDAIAGLVDLPAGSPLSQRFAASYRRGIWPGTHTHIHGANMAMRASVYLAAGGFAALRCGEDVDLWQRVKALPGLRVVADPRLVVRTSARTQNRVDGGFGRDLRDLSATGS